MGKETKSLEESFEELNFIMNELEREELSLEDSFRLYNDGMKLIKSCNDAIDKVEKKIIIINEKESVKE